MSAAWMLSQLVRKLQLTQRHGFLARHPHAWLVWEPGAWKAPDNPTHSAMGDTLRPTNEAPSHPNGDDALCYELNPKTAVMHVGRASDCELVLNDMTVSRHQFELHHAAGAWRLVDKSPGGTLVQPVSTGVLTSNTKISCGGVTLTFCDAETLVARLEQKAKIASP